MLAPGGDLGPLFDPDKDLNLVFALTGISVLYPDRDLTFDIKNIPDP